VKRVEISTDGGRTWRDAARQAPVLDRALTRFRLPWRWDGAPVVLQSRVWDETGYRQPTPQELVAARGFESNYHYNAIQSWGVTPDGKVANVRV
jgi:sulfane dehydrogenase subunit SoxC